MSDPSMTVGLVDDVDRDMIARGDRIGAALARSLLAHYDEATDRIAVLEAALRPFANSPDDWTVDTVNAARNALEPKP